MKSIYFSATGCDMQRDEFERMVLSFDESYVKTTNPFKADFVIQSFCIQSKENLEQIVNNMAFYKLVKEQNPTCKLLVGGCATTVIDFKKLYPFVDDTFGKKEMIPQILNILGESLEKKLVPVRVVDRKAIVVIASGCNRRCSFCKVGYLDMKLQSVPMEEVLNKVHYAVKNRARYITLVGENSTEYGLDLYKEKRLLDLLKAILNSEKNLRGIFISGLVIEEMSPELVDFIAKESRIHSLQMEIQSLIPEVRKAMNLHGTPEEVLAVLKKLSHKAILSNIMVGHPGETDEDFKKQLKLVRKHNLFYVMVNPFDNTPRTASYEMQQIPAKIVEKRVMALFEVISELRRKKIESLNVSPNKLSNLGFTPVRAFVSNFDGDDVLMYPFEFAAIIKVPRSSFCEKPALYDEYTLRIPTAEYVSAGGYQLMVLRGEVV